MKTKTALFLMLILILLSTMGGLLLWQKLPPLMASHWSANDQVNGYIPRFWGVFLMPSITLLMIGLFLIMPKIDPLAKNIERFRGTFNNFIVLIVVFMVYIYILTLLFNLGYTFAMSRAMLPALGVLVFAAGILIGKAQPNWFIGIRTPWTLSNDLVWEKTHRLGSVLFKVAGVLTFLGVFWGRLAFWFVMGPILLAAIVPVIYSYLMFHKIQQSSETIPPKKL
jgi:uncharacterized membrane protein